MVLVVESSGGSLQSLHLKFVGGDDLYPGKIHPHPPKSLKHNIKQSFQQAAYKTVRWAQARCKDKGLLSSDILSSLALLGLPGPSHVALFGVR